MTTAAQGPNLAFLSQIPDQDLEEIIAAIKAGAKHPGDAMGFGPEALNAIETMALGYYRSRMFDKAAAVYGFALQMNNERATAWRGLGACAHAVKRLELAVLCYRAAVQADPNDTVSQVYCGEALCQSGQKDEGLKLLNEIIKTGTKNPDYKPYITRARAVVGAGGGVPTKLVLKKQGQALAKEASEALAELPPAKGQGPSFDPNRDVTAEDMQQSPELKKLLGDLGKAVDDGRLTYAQIGGFTETELQGAYACACKYAEMGQVLQAIQIAGYLMFLDPYNAGYYQLVGICLHRMKQYENADHYYKMALTLDKENPMTLVYQGEAKLMLGRADEGIQLIKQGVNGAKGKPEWKELAERGNVLIRQFGGQ